MRCKTVIWFTVTVAAASAVQLTIDKELLVTNSIQGELEINFPHLPPATTSTSNTEEQIDTNFAGTTMTAITKSSVMTDDTTVTTADTTTEVTTTTSAINYENKTTEVFTSTTPESEDGNVSERPVSTEQTTASDCPITTESNIIKPDQVGRSSEIVEEPEPGGPTSAEQEYVVLTTRGPVQGYPWHTSSEIIGYIDVPYGSFERYFQDPTPPRPWENIHQVREHSKRCPQIQGEKYVGDLDCLTLNIFTPSEAINASVLFHVHESSFISGSGDPAIYGPEYFVTKGIILVLPNYRLGPLGFLCLRNATAQGNGALKDLNLALKWIYENIAAFGGDPSNVVISGEGTSGALVGYLALSPESNSYVSKAITESGSVLSHRALDRNPEATANTLVQRIRDMTSPNNSIQAADVETIVLAARDMTFSPCIEHNDQPFLSHTPWEMLHHGLINITFMVGSASHAGALEAANMTDGLIEQMNSDFGQFLPSDLRFDSQNSRNTVGKRVRGQYFGNSSITLGHVEEISLCFTDSSYLGPAIRTARALAQAGAKVYFYEFAFVGDLNRELNSINRPLNGTVRGDIVGYLFSQDGMKPAEGTVERQVADLMTDLWVSFIDGGQPTAENVTWAELIATVVSEEQWLSIGDDVELKVGLHMNRLRLWTTIYEEYFIEHNFALQHLSNIYSLLFSLVFCVGFWKISP